jgi:hypothetical protein
MHAGVSPQGRRRAALVLPAELQRFRQVIGSHNIGTLQIGDRPGDAQQAIEAARGQRDFFEGTSEPYPGPTFDGAPGDAYPGTGVRNGFAPGTARLLLSYDYAFSSHLTAGLRAGYAFFGGPASRSGKNFLPVHAEVRGTYWFTDSATAKGKDRLN